MSTLARMTSHNLPTFEPDTAYEVWANEPLRGPTEPAEPLRGPGEPEGGLRRILGGMSGDDAYDLAQRYAKAEPHKSVAYYVVAASTVRMWKETI